MRFSVVINTFNRAESLRTTLRALRHQTFRDFEVIVVNGPSTDGTATLLQGLDGQLRVVQCPEQHLSKSRNLGIDAAAGDVVAFIDDDGVPEPRWLSDLAAAYDSDRVGGAGGMVLDHTGVRAQYRFSLCSRIGLTDFDVTPPFDANNVAGADPYVYLQGTNASFRREVLAAIGGFDEEIEYNYDEAEVCLQVVDAGFELTTLPGAVVHHKFLPSHLRREAGFFTDPYLSVKNRAYFAVRNGRGRYSLEEIFRSLTDYVTMVLAGADDAFEHGRFTALEHDHFVTRLRAGFELGVERGLAGVRQSRPIVERDESAFLPYATLAPDGRRLGVCFVSLDYPPGPSGGIARYTHDLARGFAQAGHEVHVVTRAPGQYRMDFEDGVWVHRYPHTDRFLPTLEHHPLAGNLAHLAAVHAAVSRVCERAPIDVVTGPLWAAEPTVCGLDPRTVTSLTCMTPMRVVAETQPVIAELEHTGWQIRLEDVALTRVQQIQSISHANLETIRRTVPAARELPAEVIWLGADDRRADFPRRRLHGDGKVEVLFVGRLEPRKGVDTLLEAAIELVRERSWLHVRLVGADSGHSTVGGQRYAEWLAERCAGEPGVLERFHFEGEVSDERLYQCYADADVFCAPSRYESFGLVLVEAQMMGCPVVACRAGGMPEVVGEDETGLLTQPGDVAGLRAALASLVDDPELRGRMGAAGRERFEREFDSRVAVARTASLYERISPPHPSGAGRVEPDAPEVVRRELAQLLTELIELPADHARRAAEELLEPTAFPIDYEAYVRRLLPLADEAFVVGLYELFLAREPEPEGLEAHLGTLGTGTPRTELVRTIAGSVEARVRGVSAGYVSRLGRLHGREAERRVRAVWTLDDRGFVTGLHEALLGADVDDATVEAAQDALANGSTRRDVLVQLVATGQLDSTTMEPSALLEAEFLERATILAEIRGLGRLPAADYVDGLFRLLLGRPPGEPESQAFVARIRGPAGRAAVLLDITESAEAQSRGIERSWLPEAMSAVRRPLQTRVLKHLSSQPGAARATRLGRRAASRARGAVIELTGVRRTVEELRGSIEAHALSGGSEVAALSSQVVDLIQAQRAGTFELAARFGAVARTQAAARDGTRVELEALGGHLAALGGHLAALEDRLEVMGKKHDALALDVRERLPVLPSLEEWPEPEIVDLGHYDRRRREPGALRVNLGCGEKPLEGYVNVDFRALPGVDVVADVRRLPFEPGTVDEIASAHLVEHFRQHHLETVILPYWRSLLAGDGQIRIICPNWAVMIEQLNGGELSFGDFKTVTFGLQDYSGDDHLAMYTPESLSSVLERAGFGGVEILEERRQNGISPELELIARPNVLDTSPERVLTSS